MANKSPRRHSDEFKQETVDLVLKQGYSVADAARAVGIIPVLLYKWKTKHIERWWEGRIIAIAQRNKTASNGARNIKKASAYFAKHVKQDTILFN